MMKIKSILLALLLSVLLVCCTKKDDFLPSKNVDQIAHSYIKLAFAFSKFDPDYIDSYFGPDSLKKLSIQKNMNLPDIIKSSQLLIEKLETLSSESSNEEEHFRLKNLKSLLVSLKFRAKVINKESISFDKESKEIYNVILPTYSLAYYKNELNKLNNLLPGKGDVTIKFINFIKKFIIPNNKLDTILKTTIKLIREKSNQNISLPKDEIFQTEYVKNQPWLAYNWFKGQSKSLIQFNLDQPFALDWLVGVIAHEGYPGHHVFHSLTEQKFFKDKGWIEFSMVPLFSPTAVVSEGLANYASELLFNDNERIEFELKLLKPYFNFSYAELQNYHQILKLKRNLKYAGNEVARRYLDGKMSKEMAIKWLQTYELRTQESAVQSIKFIEKYRSYVLNYTLGYDLIKEYINQKAGADRKKQWEVYSSIIRNHLLPEDLIK